MSDKNKKSSNAADSKLSLSAALLAPINSLFETQVHAARAFLNFILQMGFKDNLDKDTIQNQLTFVNKQLELYEDDKNSDQLPVDFDQDEAIKLKEALIQEKENLVAYKELNEKRSRNKDLTKAEKETFKVLDNKYSEDIFTQKIKYKDGQGVVQNITIPNLALIPVQPLAVKSAKFDFHMSSISTNESFREKQKGRLIQNSPWAFISPRRINGKIASSVSEKEQSGISIHVEIETTPIPQGLSNLLTSLTQSGRVENEN